MGLSFAVYGKGGSGKSSLAASLSSCFAAAGRRVLHFGCDPKSDSSRLLLAGRRVETVVGTAADTDLYDASSLLMPAIHGITCVEAGGPEPGVGCAGRGITRAFEVLEELDVALGEYDVVVYDVLGDVVCGGFAAPLRSGYARHVLIVASGTGMSLFAANNIMRAVKRFHRNGVRLAGLVGNYHTGETFRHRVERFAAATGTQVLAHVPHDPDIQRAEEVRQTIVDFRPDGPSAQVIRALAERLPSIGDTPPPQPFDLAAYERFIAENP
jgi:nitrogenase iron protein NifH